MNALLLAGAALALVMLAVNSVCGLVAYSMAARRSLRQLPAFFAAFFGSVAAVFYIAMFPVVEKKEEFPKGFD